MFRAVAHSLQRLDRPMLVVLDDVQHAQRAALLLLRFLVGALVRSPLVLVTPGAPSTDGFAGRTVARRPRAGLDVDSLRPFAPRHNGVPHREPHHRETRAGAGRRSGAAAGDGRQSDVPGQSDGVRLAQARPQHRAAAVGDALGRLPDTSRDTVAAAAVLGNGCSVAEVAALRDTPAAVILADLAAARDLVTVHRAGVSFDHELVRQAALSTLGSAALLDLHARAAQLPAPRPGATGGAPCARRRVPITEDAALAIQAPCRRLPMPGAAWTTRPPPTC